jgi:hypothetical protein
MSLTYTIAEIDIEMNKYRNLIEMLELNMKAIRADNAALKRLIALKKKYQELVDENNLLIGEHWTLRELVNN